MNLDHQSTNLESCTKDCEQLYRSCLLEGEAEVFCRIQWVPCESQCNEEYHAFGT